MFERLGQFVSRNWAVLLTGWIVAFAFLFWIAPKWDSVIYDGEFHYLPERFPSRQAETLSKKAFSNNFGESNVVIVARRENSPEGLLDEDKTFIEETLVPRVEKSLGLAPEKDASDTADSAKTSAAAAKADAPSSAPDSGAKPDPIVSRIRTFSDKEFGQLLISDDQKATLVLLELTTDFTERRNEPTIAKIGSAILRGPSSTVKLAWPSRRSVYK